MIEPVNGMSDGPFDRAERYSEQTSKALHKLGQIEHHLGGLLGEWVHGAIGRPLENASESYSEARYQYKRAFEALGAVTDERKMRLDAAYRDLGAALALLKEAADDTTARFGRSRKTPPPWVARALSLTRSPMGQAVIAVEPF